MNPPNYTSLPDRFWSKVDVDPSGCWLWSGCLVMGYGAISFEGRNQGAHRLAAQEIHGPIPKGMFVLHHCDVRECVYPTHLFYGTHQDNMDDMVGKHRQRAVHGEAHGRSKMTDAQVIEMRHLRATQNWLQEDLALRYGIKRNTVSTILSRKNWAHLADDISKDFTGKSAILEATGQEFDEVRRERNDDPA